MTLLKTIAQQLEDAGASLQVALAAVERLSALPEDEQPVSVSRQAKLLGAAEYLSDRAESLCDTLTGLVPEAE